MRHRKSGRKLNRNSPQRNALKKSLAISIIEHESVKTTLAKAKEIRSFLEPLVTLAKENTVANQRLAYSRLQSKEAVAKLFDELGPRYKNRPGGYLRVIKRGLRQGDKAPAAQIEFVTEEGAFEVEGETETPVEETALLLNSFFRCLPVCDFLIFVSSSGVPTAIISPPSEPPSGPKSITQSLVLITSMLCSITTTVFPLSRNLFKTLNRSSTSYICRPVVGSSSIYKV